VILAGRLNIQVPLSRPAHSLQVVFPADYTIAVHFSLNIVSPISYISLSGGMSAMKLIKFILAILGMIFGVMLFFWLFGLVSTLLWYAVMFGLLAAVGYGGYKLFVRAEQKYVGDGAAGGYLDDRDYSLSWEEYDRKYLKK
jgi:hypothetical protein